MAGRRSEGVLCPALMNRRLRALALAAALLPAAAWAKPQLQTFFQATLADAAYQQKVFAKVAKLWKQPKATPESGKKK